MMLDCEQACSHSCEISRRDLSLVQDDKVIWSLDKLLYLAEFSVESGNSLEVPCREPETVSKGVDDLGKTTWDCSESS